MKHLIAQHSYSIHPFTLKVEQKPTLPPQVPPLEVPELSTDTSKLIYPSDLVLSESVFHKRQAETVNDLL